MLVRTIILFSMLFMLTACGTDKKDEGLMDSEQMTYEEMTPGPLDEEMTPVYEEQVDGPRPGTQADLVVNVGDRVFFGYDRYDLTQEAQQTLDLQAQWLRQYPHVTVTIAGHTDERGTREYNLALGERRANSVKNYLVALGIDPRRITTISYGKERPAVMESNPSGWAQNRRAVTKVD